MSYWNYRPYVSVGQKKAKAEKKLKQLKKKNPNIRPVVINGKAIAQSWWGKSWNSNLEKYADYSNRIGRGRSYVRHSAVLDLQISPGQVKSMVQGSRSKPYSVVINIKKVQKNIWKEMKDACAGKLDSLPELLEGKFPKALREIFTAQGNGLFPSPKEIEFDCSCPDWAYMCKHVAATLYGIGARLDDDPGLFFKLRKVTMDDLVQQAVDAQSYKLLEKAEKTEVRTIAETDLSEMFGIDLDEDIELVAKPVPSKKAVAKKKAKKKKAPLKALKKKTATKKAAAKKKALKKKTAKKVVAKTTKKTKPKTIKAKAAPKKSAGKKSVRVASKKAATKKKALPAKKRVVKKSPEDQVTGIIRRSRKGVTVAAIKEKTGLDDQKIRNIIFKAYNKGKIQRVGRGVYKGKVKTGKNK